VPKKIVNLGLIKDLLAEWDRVRSHIVSGDITGFQTVFLDSDSHESIFTGGVCKDDPRAALKAALRLSMARTLSEDTPPAKRVGT
jgi:hypothetical protein